jgi:hypothetical protein
LKIDWKVIPHREQRYDTTGDWQLLGDDIVIRTSDLGNPDYNFLEGLHEVVEAYLCKRMGITQKMVDDYDFAYETAHQRGDANYPCGCPYNRLSDPGSDPHSPYLCAHLVAEAVEAIVARTLRADWKEYDELAEKPPE